LHCSLGQPGDAQAEVERALAETSVSSIQQMTKAGRDLRRVGWLFY
jgi:hypothetical protein